MSSNSGTIEHHPSTPTLFSRGTTPQWAMKCAVFASIVASINRIPVAGVKYDGWDAGTWFTTQKSEKKKPNLEALRLSHPLVEKELDRFLAKPTRTLNTPWGEYCARFARIVDRLQEIPGPGRMFSHEEVPEITTATTTAIRESDDEGGGGGKLWNAGLWYVSQKTERKPDRLAALRQAHPIIDLDLDRVLSVPIAPRETDWQSQCDRFIALVHSLGHLPLARVKYDGWYAHSWLSSQIKDGRAARLTALSAGHPLIRARLSPLVP